jgi:hypothetical protein
MVRGLAALLSPNEEVTLRRVAYGVVVAKTLHPGHLARLRNLALIEDHEGALSITKLGQQRLFKSPVARLDTASVVLDDGVRALALALKVTKL